MVEDEIESDDPLELERLTDNVDIIKEDAERFRKLCRQYCFNFTKLNREYERKLCKAKPLKERLADVQWRLECAKSQREKKRLSKEVSELEQEIEKIMQLRYESK